jgi:F0F1-type ATP synthase membrane subunit c/vacuolar-type H+-ATPase subunit K
MAALSESVVAPNSPPLARQAPDPLEESARLGRDIVQVQAEMERGIQLAGLKNDPVLPLIRVLSSSLSLQWRLHDQAIRYFHDATERLDQQLVETIAKGERVLETRRISIVEYLGKELAKLSAKNGWASGQTVPLKTAITFGGIAVASALMMGLAGYGVGWKVGHSVALVNTGAAATLQTPSTR